MKILFTTVCNDDYALGGQVMLYSMRENIKNWQDCDFKIYHNKDFAHLSRENQAIFKKIMPDIIFEHVDKECYFDSKLPPAGNRAQGCKAAYLTLESFNETEYDKVIMFDVDMLCIGDLSDLFESDFQFGIYNRNTGFVVIGKDYRSKEIHEHLTSQIYSHDGQFMDQGIVNKTFGHIQQVLPQIYNQYPVHTLNEDTRILHWAHYDHIKPWTIDEWEDKVDLFQDVPPYPYPNKETGNVPVLKDKPAFDMWKNYKEEMQNEYNK